MGSELLKVGVLVSGRGSNLQAIIDASERGEIQAQVVVVVSDKGDALALKRAQKHGIEALFLNPDAYPNREAYERAMGDELERRGVELICLAGYMRVLSPYFVRRFSGRIMNIHPALLPSFPGLHGQLQALDYGVKVSGCTVHFVDEEVDHGPIIIQAVVPVLDDDDEDALSSRILEYEHKIYPRAIQLFAQGRLKVQKRRVKIEGIKPETWAAVNPPLQD